MLIIGERINSTRTYIEKAIRARDAAFLKKEAISQFRAGASILDVNCAMGLERESEDIDWVISVIQSELPQAGICIDSPNHLVIEKALQVYKGKGRVFINSITADESRIKDILPLAIKYNTSLIALIMDETGMPDTKEARRDIAGRILQAIKGYGFDETKLYFDPLVRPVSTEPEQAMEFLGSIALIKKLGKVKTICGLSNISFGLPKRSIINAAFLNVAAINGLDAAIIDPLDKNVAAALLASEAISGKDRYCKNYLTAFREGRL